MIHMQGKELSNTCALMDVGIKGDANLRLEVKSKAGGAASFSGPPISLKVRTHGGKTFKVEITTVSCRFCGEQVSILIYNRFSLLVL